jgi:hypothetical protein
MICDERAELRRAAAVRGEAFAAMRHNDRHRENTGTCGRSERDTIFILTPSVAGGGYDPNIRGRQVLVRKSKERHA